MGEQLPNTGDGWGEEPWKIWRQNIVGRANSQCGDLCQKASVAGVQGAPGEVDMNEGHGQGCPAPHQPARWESGVEILMSMIEKNALKDSGQGRGMN